MPTATLVPHCLVQEVLRDRNSNILCQSFDFQPENFITGMRIGYDRNTGKFWSANNTSGRNLYIRLANSEFGTNSSITQETKETGGNDHIKRNILIIATTVSFMILAASVFICWMRKKKPIAEGEDLLSFDFSVKPKPKKCVLITSSGIVIQCGSAVEIALFSFSSVSVATNNFAYANKLGEGGFGPVYKGKLLNGYEVAVKRLSNTSAQGWEEIKNEGILTAKLDHKNLVKVLGCCVEGDERIIIYEYLQNKSLDHHLFGSAKHGILDWDTRVRIIEGIAEGLLYLHQFSNVRIIHRDLKASNILLDKDMNPKISDFGLARTFGEDESQASKRIAGTYGYMSPEYVLKGIFSVKSDVFSFGILLLEILSGMKSSGFDHSGSLSLPGYIWDLWRNDMALELMDPTLGDISSSSNAALRYINIALLCVQEHASDRPTMADVISMFSSEDSVPPSPKQPAFANARSTLSQLEGNEESVFSVNEMTASIMEAR